MTSPSPDTGGRRIDRTLLVGFGALGHRLAPELVAGGSEVFAVRRRRGDLPSGVTGIVADVSLPFENALPSVDTLIVTLPPGPVVDGYCVALGHIAAALPSLPERTVFVSSTGVFDGAFDGERAAERVTEETLPAPTTARARALLDGEVAAVELFSAVVLRPAGIYGPGREFLIRQVREQRPVDHGRWTNRIHETDLVRAILALVRADAPPRVLHAVDGRPALMRDVVSFIARTIDLPVPGDSGDSEPHGKIIDGRLLDGFLGALEHPSFESGYAEMLATSPSGEAPHQDSST